MKIKLKRDYPFAHEGIRIVEYKEGQETEELPEHICQILIDRGDACKCECKKVEKKVEESKEDVDEKVIETPKEPEENKLLKPEENKLPEPKENKKAKPKKNKKAKK